MALPQTGMAGGALRVRGALTVNYITRRISVATVKGQCHKLLGRLEVLVPGTAAAEAQDQEQRWRRARQAMLLSEDLHYWGLCDWEGTV